MLTTVTEAWQMVVPPPGDRHGPLSPLLLGLTVITGLVDSFSYLVLGHVFVANMTGNVVFLAFALAGAKGFSLAASALALAAFALGALISGRFVVHLGERRGRMVAVSSACQAVLVAAAMIVTWTVTDAGVGGWRYVLVLLLALGSGMQTGTARKVAIPDLTTTVLTQTITGAAFDSRLGGGTGSRIGRRGFSAVAMFVGALIGALTVIKVDKPVALLLALVLLVTVAVAAGLLSRSRPTWDQPG
jgi:uncharacterized membrane protein YoaK (UPF0700 family)